MILTPKIIASTNQEIFPTILHYNFTKPGNGKLCYSFIPLDIPTHSIDIVLIDSSNVVKDDLCVFEYGLFSSIHNYNGKDTLEKYSKIIFTSNKEHVSGKEHDDSVPYPKLRDKKITELSTESINILINYYNIHSCMPDKVEVTILNNQANIELI